MGMLRALHAAALNRVPISASFASSAWLLCLAVLPALCHAQLGYRQKGNASYYGKQFHGRTTSNGERFDMYQLTAAHKELPFGAMLRVENLENGRSVIVRVNDRGPFKPGRVVDVSYAAAQDLDMIRDGVVPVRLEVVGLEGKTEAAPDATRVRVPEAAKPAKKPRRNARNKRWAKREPAERTPKPAPAAGTPAAPDGERTVAAADAFRQAGEYNLWGARVNYRGLYCLQVGAYAEVENARKAAQRLYEAGYHRAYVQVGGAAGARYRVVVGLYDTPEQARENLAEVAAKGFEPFVTQHR